MVIDSFEGKVKLKIAPETQNGTQVKLKGKGFPVYKKEGQVRRPHHYFYDKNASKSDSKGKRIV